jgi:hypothetical protein
MKALALLHILFIPVLPLGNWRYWRCSVCGCNPHAQPSLGKGIQWAAVLLLAVAAFGVWMGPVEEDPFYFWGGRIIFPPLFVVVLRYTLRSKPDLRLRDKLMEIHPGDDVDCPCCGRPLVLGDTWRCSGCVIKKIPLRLTQT